jgi:4-hydroxybenzoate polyprenyltransferase
LKKHLRSFNEWTVYSNLFIALCAAGLTWETFVLLQAPVWLYWYLPLIFFSVLFIYNLHYYQKIKPGDGSDRYKWVFKYRHFSLGLMINCLLFITGGVALKFKDVFTENGKLRYLYIFLFAGILLVSLAYSHPIIPFTKKTLRQAGWLKLLLLGFVWAFATTILPVMMLYKLELTKDNTQLVALFVHRFIFIASIAVLFNIRDYAEDKKDNIKTIAVVAGPQQTLLYGKWITLVLNTVAGICLAGSFSFKQPAIIFSLVLPALLIFALYHFFKPGQDEAVFVWRHDGLMLLKALLLIFALKLFS